MPDPLDDLLKRLAEATDGSCELNDAIWSVAIGHEFRWREGKRPEWLVKACYCSEYPRHAEGAEHWRSFKPGDGGPSYTHSLDAALLLVPERHAWSAGVGHVAKGYARLHSYGYGELDECRAATAPLALCIASLKALTMSRRR